MNNYKGIEFAKGYNRPFADFKHEFEHTHIFKNIPSAKREKALKEAYKIATTGIITRCDIFTPDFIAEIKVMQAKEIKANGDHIRTTSKSKETK